jgi:hypothetical protein
MRYTVAIAAAILAATACANPQYVSFEVAHTTASTNVLTQTLPVIGYVDEVYVKAPSQAGVTANVSVVVSPSIDTGLTSTTLFTNGTLTAADIARPRVAQTDNEGTNLSTLTVPERYLCVGDSVTLTVTQSSEVTNVTYKVFLKVDQ